MDREIPKEVRQKERNKKIIRYSSIGVASIIAIGVLISVLRAGVEAKDLVFSTVDKGVIEVSVSASGKVVPAFEEIINSPINSRIIEVYKKGGDSVDVGTPILKLDLQSTEIEYKKLLDEEQMRQYKLDQLRVNNQTKLSDMAMQIKVSAMKLSRMKVELRNEHYLDSLGAGTTDKVRQAELSYNVAQLEYEQLQQQYKNEKEVAAAELKVQELDFNIFRKSLSEKKRTLDDAQIRSPRKAILTYINNQIGAQISEGGQVAIISDLSHFKVEGEIADTYGDRVAAGGKAIVKIGSDKLEGTVSSVTPLSKNGVISFTVQLKEDNHICFDYFFLPCEVHGRTSAICCRCPFYFFHLDAGYFTVLTQKLIGSQAPATGTTFFMAGGRFENYRPLRPGRRRIVADGRFGHNFNLRDAGCSLSYTGSDTVRTGVSTADHKHFFAFGIHQFVFGESLSFQNPVLLRQHFQCEMDSFQLPSRNA